MSSKNVKQTVSHYLTKLSDRDTEPMAAAELEIIARGLTADEFPQFLSTIADTRPADKTPLRRHSIKLLSVVAGAHPPAVSAPHFPRMLGSVLRRLRDGDSSVRAACVEAVRSMAIAHPPAVASVLLAPLVDALGREQDQWAQAAAALALAAAVEAGAGEIELVCELQRLVPRVVKLARGSVFKAKAALLGFLGSIAKVGGVGTEGLVELLVPCLVEALNSEDWAARKAGAEALAAVAVAEKELLVGFRGSCLLSFESKRFDKVKIVRESMNRMLEVWKDIPEVAEDKNMLASQEKSSSLVKDSIVSECPNPAQSAATPITVRKGKPSPSRSPPPVASPIPAIRKNAPLVKNKNSSPPLSSKSESKPPNLRFDDIPVQPERSDEVKKEKSCDNKGNKLVGAKSTSRVVPVQDTEDFDPDDEDDISHEELNAGDKDCDLSSIRMQLLQIENQQSYLMDILQKFIGKSQNGINSLETRVHGLEITLNEISRDLAFSGRIRNDPAVNSCCRLPGSEFLSPKKLWRRTEGRFPTRFSVSDAENLTEKESRGFFKWDKHKFAVQGGLVAKPLSENYPQLRRSIDVPSGEVAKMASHECVTPVKNARNVNV